MRKLRSKQQDIAGLKLQATNEENNLARSKTLKETKRFGYDMVGKVMSKHYGDLKFQPCHDFRYWYIA